MKKPRTKKYHPRPVSKTGGLAVFDKHRERARNVVPLATDRASDLSTCHWSSLDRLLTGDGSEEAFSRVCCALSVATVLCEAGIGAEHEAAFERAIEGAGRAQVRATTGSYRLDGEAMRDIKQALTLYDAQLEVATRGEVNAALQVLRRRLVAQNQHKEAA